jgi:hypothetical protein
VTPAANQPGGPGRENDYHRRFSNSLFMHWRSQQKNPRHKTTTDFFSATNAEHHRYAIRCLNARQPSFQTRS